MTPHTEVVEDKEKFYCSETVLKLRARTTKIIDMSQTIRIHNSK